MAAVSMSSWEQVYIHKDVIDRVPLFLFPKLLISLLPLLEGRRKTIFLFVLLA